MGFFPERVRSPQYFAHAITGESVKLSVFPFWLTCRALPPLCCQAVCIRFVPVQCAELFRREE